MLSARSAHADNRPQIFPLVVTSRLPPELNGTPEALTSALATMLDGEISDRSLEAVGKTLRCDIEIATCLDRVARSLATKQLVYGTLLITVDGKVRVKLVRFDSAKSGSELYQRTFVLSASTPKRLGKQLARASAKMFGREVRELREVAAPTPPEPPTPAEPTTPAEPITPAEPTPPIITSPEQPESAPAGSSEEPSGGRITMGTYALIGSGALIAAGGAGFLYSAYDLRDQIRAAPRATPDDLSRLADLEDTALLRDRIGTALAVGGGAVLVVGVMRALAQRDSGPGVEAGALARARLGRRRGRVLGRSEVRGPISPGAALVRRHQDRLASRSMTRLQATNRK